MLGDSLPPGAAGPVEKDIAMLADIQNYPALCFWCARIAAFAAIENQVARRAANCSCQKR